MAANVTRISEGLVIASPGSGNLVIGPDQAVTIKGTRIDGGITLDGGVLYVTGAARVHSRINIKTTAGTILVDGGSTFPEIVFRPPRSTPRPLVVGVQTALVVKRVNVEDAQYLRISDNSRVGGRVRSSNVEVLKITDSVIHGSVRSRNDHFVTITNNRIEGALRISGAGNCDCAGNSVSGLVIIR